MEKFVKKIAWIFLVVALVFNLVFSLTTPIPIRAQQDPTNDEELDPDNPPEEEALGLSEEERVAKLAAEIDLFLGSGAQGFLVWQYGGDYNGRQIAVDQYSFYRDKDKAICDMMQEKAGQYPDKFLGVNINNIGAAEFTDGTATSHMTWLKDNCGTKVVRIFAKIEEVQGVMNALDAAAASGVQIIVAVGDYSNGGGGMPQGANQQWYETGWQGEYQALAEGIVTAINASPNKGALYGIELANEPHCGGDADAIDPYTNSWGAGAGALLGQASGRIGYGQMAMQNSTRCDSPGANNPLDGRPDFVYSNDIPQITMTSAHYYTEQEMQNALQALELSNTQLGKPFYIGEAPPGGNFYDSTVGSGYGYDLSIYPFYDYDDTDFYLFPICTEEDKCPPGAPFEILSPGIKYNLVKQGYEVHCAAPQADIELEKQRDWEIFLKYAINNPVIPGLGQTFDAAGYTLPFLDVESTQVVDYLSAKSPMFRDVSERRWFMNSIEEFFGFKDIYVQNPTRAQVTTSPIETLLSTDQKCRRVRQLMMGVVSMCDRLTIPQSECPLYHPIPGTDMTTDQMWEQLAPKSCGEVMSGNSELREAVLNTELHLDRAYRVAFLVVVVEQRESTPARLFSYFVHNNEDADPRDQVFVIAFKVPDVGLDHHPEQLRYEHPVQLTRDTLIPFAQREEIVAEKNRLKDARLSEAGGQGLLPQSGASTVQCDGDNSECQVDPMVRALVDMINGSQQECGSTSLSIEEVKSITDPVQITTDPPSEQRKFKKDVGQEPAQLPEVLIPSDTDPPVERTDFNFFSDFYVDYDQLSQDGDDIKTRVRTYLIYPGDYDLRTTAPVIAGTFLTNQQQTNLMADPELKERYPFLDAAMKLLGGNVSRDFPDVDNCYFDPIDKVWKCPRLNFGLLIKSIQDPASLPGAYLGFWARTIQKTLHPYYSQAYAYLESCKTTEEFLLGLCAGGDVPPTTGGGTIGSELACMDLRQLTVELPPSLDALKDDMCAIAGGNANDAQLLWGMLQVDGSPFLREILNGASSMSCGDILLNSCGASQIFGVLVPQCIDTQACPQAAYIANDTSDPWVQEVRNNPEIACNINVQAEYILRKRKSEIGYVISQYEAANGSSPSTKQIYYMLAARNYGLLPEVFTKPACEGAPPVSGCNGLNYCECVMDGFPISCN